MRLSKFTSYAIRILIDCAEADGASVRAADISERQHITEYNIQKIVALLAQEGFLTTTRGRNGGITLSRPANEIGLGDVVRAFESGKLEADCVGDQIDCAVRQMTPINRIFNEAYTSFVLVLDKYTVADLLRGRVRAMVLDAQ
jgi:Rrf2 family protein